jgi:uncharacterized Ntn-hydrolase superfamily protein
MSISRIIPAHTYSIVAHDPETKQFGVAVQSHYFCVGGIVSWAEAGVGAVATQSFAEVTYGPLGLALMRAGKTANQVLEGLLASDPQADGRQVAMVDGLGNVATHTGARCIQAAGHRQGNHYSAQANLMLKDTVWGAMAEAYEAATGDLADRLLAALDAAQAEGGDIRGRQSAALLVVGGERTGNPWAGRLFDLRVDDHPEPLVELRRLVKIARAYRIEDELEAILMGQTVDTEELERLGRLGREQAEMMLREQGNPELLYWQAVGLTTAGRLEDALPIFKRVFSMDSAWRDLVPRMVDAGLLPGDEGIIKRILEA